MPFRTLSATLNSWPANQFYILYIRHPVFLPYHVTFYAVSRDAEICSEEQVKWRELYLFAFSNCIEILISIQYVSKIFQTKSIAGEWQIIVYYLFIVVVQDSLL